MSCFLLLVATVAGCEDGAAPGQLPLIDRTRAPPPVPVMAVVAYGTVTALGSVSINGVRYDTSGTAVTIHGRPGTQADLHVGDVVLVAGRLHEGGLQGVADRIFKTDAVRGPIGSIDSKRSLVVLGQRVTIDAATTFDDSVPQGSLAGLAVGDVVEVAGLRAADGKIFATRIAAQAFGGREFSTTGIASNVDVVARRFAINGLVVDYGTAAIEGFASGAVADGDFVEVGGASLRPNGDLLARSVALEVGPFSGNSNGVVEIEGYVASFDVRTPVTFALGGVNVTTTPETSYHGGVYTSLGLDTRVEVEGRVRHDGVVIASKVRCVRASPVRVGALVDSVSADTSSFVMLGITVRIDAFTRIEDRSVAAAQLFNLADLRAGDYARVSGVEEPVGSNTVLASLIERRDPQAVTELQGHVQPMPIVLRTWRQPVSILGVTATATDATTYGGLGEGTFFFDLERGALVYVRGVEVTDREIVASEMRYVF
jgi:hypothetical protein